jgi:hypothetical protein
VTLHVYPLNDLRDHDLESETCWCQPRTEDLENEVVVIHNALDQREKYESGELRLQ